MPHSPIRFINDEELKMKKEKGKERKRKIDEKRFIIFKKWVSAIGTFFKFKEWCVKSVLQVLLVRQQEVQGQNVSLVYMKVLFHTKLMLFTVC